MAEPYGLPPDTAINYGVPWPNPWVDELCRQWGLDSSTYPGHQTGDRPDIGAAPNPQRLNRGIDWAGDPQKMLDFAHWLVSIGPHRTPGQYGPPGLEMVIFQDPRTGERVGYPGFVDYGGDYSGHTDHVHTRQSAALIEAAPPQLSRQDRYALAVIAEGRKRGISKRGICIALSVPFVESGWKNYANSNVPDSLNYPHDAVGSDHDSTGLYQQRQAWGPLSVTMDPAGGSAGLFFDGGAAGQRGLTDFDYDNEANSPGFYAQAVQVSAFPDRYQQHWDEAVALYDRLAGVPPITVPTEEEGFLMALSEQEQRELLDRIRQLSGLYDLTPSKSRYADDRAWNSHDFIRNVDGHVFDLITEHNAALGDEWSLQTVRKAAAGGDKIAAAFLQRLTAGPSTTPAPTMPVTPPPAPTPQIQPTIQYLPAPQTSNNGNSTTGQLIGNLFSALEALRLADAMPIEARAPMAALVNILQTKAGLTS